MILSAARSVIYNNHEIQAAYYNGQQLWPVGLRYDLAVDSPRSDTLIGLTAVKDGTQVYARSPLSGSFTASIAEDAEVSMQVINPAYNRPDVNSTGISFSQASVSASDSASSVYTGIMTADASVSVPSLHANEFVASGVFHSASARADYATFWMPAEMTYLSGNSDISAITPVFSSYRYYTGTGGYAEGSAYVDMVTFKPNVRYSSYNSGSRFQGGGSCSTTTNNVNISASATAYIGDRVSSGYNHTLTTKARKGVAAYGSGTLNEFTLSTNSLGRIESGSTYFGVCFKGQSDGNSLPTVTVNIYGAYWNGEPGWSASGVAP
jgi:hypothetical protein